MMNPNAGKGPFVIANEPATLAPNGDLKAVQVVDQLGEPFCYVAPLHCHGQDWSAAKARAQRIVESLNRTEGHSK